MREIFPELAGLGSLYRLQQEMSVLSGFDAINYACCINSCCLFAGDLKDSLVCPHCKEARNDGRNRPRRTFAYMPLIPRLLAFFLNPEITQKLMYRATYPRRDGLIEDIFDGSHYQRLLKTFVTIAGEQKQHKFFALATDIALGISTDGFAPFKRRKQTCWPIVGIIYNFPPQIRVRLENLLCFGVIPGPKTPKDMSSFLIPLVEELQTLAQGVAAYDSLNKEPFALRAYLIAAFGDMPAVAKLMCMKGPNGVSPCRACNIKGCQDPRPGLTTYYTPLHRTDRVPYDPLNLPLRTHRQTLERAVQIAKAPTKTRREELQRSFGINGISPLLTLPGISVPESFPHDFMHLALENVLQELIDLWVGDYKGLDAGTESYQLHPSVWDAIGRACADSGKTIPSSFGRRVPNPASKRHEFIAETWLLFGTMVGPAVLRSRFEQREYYQHFVQLATLLNKCIALTCTEQDIDEIETGFAEWVTEFERYARGEYMRM